jgi:nitrogen fixation/metabolism regulation signal transduction histidine kinase
MSRKTSVRWSWLVAATAFVGVGLVLLFVLSLTGERGTFVEQHIEALLWLNIAVAALLVLVILLAALRLAIRTRQGKFGSLLLIKLAGIFALVGVVPGVLIYTVSVQFVSRSIEVWFDARVQNALDAGIDLGRGTLDSLVSDLGNKTRTAADRLAESRGATTPLALERVREQLSAQEVVLVGGSGQILLTATGSGTVIAPNIAPERPSPALLRQARNQRVVSQIEGLDDENVANAVQRARVRAIARLPATDLAFGSEDRFLLVVQPIPPAVAGNALAVQSAYREYQQRALARDGLRRMYLGTLTLALVLAVFGAVLLAAVLGTQLARPLLLLAEGVKQVAAGDLTAKPVSTSRDEIGGLTRSFADMTEQLGHAREEVQRGVSQLESARTHLQTILDSLTAGVIVFDAERRIDTVNPGATRILKVPLSAYRGRELAEVPGMEDFAQAVWQRFELHRASPEAGERDHWQDAFDLPAPGSSATSRATDAETLSLLIRGATLPADARLLVFDDISEVVSAQRQAAWSEVARRLAHEIKNPLTPIQLSAERLQMKLEPKLAGDDAGLLNRSVATIVSQVDAMKRLVNEFRDYARLPAAQLTALDLNALVMQVLALYGDAADRGRLAAACAPGLPPIQGDPAQLRQVIHNLVQNALDAVAERPDGRVQISTELVRGDKGDARVVRLAVQDNGPGFAEKVLKRAFEPYVTTKSKGTGLGLAVVKKIADEHGARLRAGNLVAEEGAPVRGARVSLSFALPAEALKAAVLT